MIFHFVPERVKFGDENSLKDQELYKRDARRNPLTGEVPPIITSPNFKNTHSITGFCGIDRRTNPVWYRIHKFTNDAEQFRDDVEAAIRDGFLQPRDILVLDNATIHTGKDNKVLAESLWDSFSIYVLFLPPRTPEWNPIELVWNTLVQRIGKYPLSRLREKNN